MSPERMRLIQTYSLLIVAVVATGAALYWLRSVLLPFVLAAFLSVLLAPVIAWFERRLHAPRWLAATIAFALGLGIVSAVCVWIWFSVAALVADAGLYEQRLRELVQNTSDALHLDAVLQDAEAGDEGSAEDDSPTGEAAASLVAGDDAPSRETAAKSSGSASIEARVTPPEDAVGSSPSEAKRKADAMTFSSLANRAEEWATDWIGGLTGELTGVLSNLLLVSIFMLFMLFGDGDSVARPDGWREIEKSVRDYMAVKSVISVGTGVLFGLVLWMFDVPLAVLFGLLAVALNFIPNIGPVVAAMIPLPLILLHPELSIWAMGACIALAVTVQTVSGNVVEPQMLGRSMKLHPVTVMLALMFWGMIWGIIGMALAAPITSAIKIILDKFETGRPIARLLEGRFDVFGTPESAKTIYSPDASSNPSSKPTPDRGPA